MTEIWIKQEYNPPRFSPKIAFFKAVEAEVVAPGLAIHSTNDGRAWVITHIPSGLRFNAYQPNEESARAKALKLAALDNWDRPMGSKRDIEAAGIDTSAVEKIMRGR